MTASDADLLHEARILCGRGFHPIPVPYRSKNPMLAGWPELRLDAETVSQHFNGKRGNIGVLTGIGGFVDVDLDCPEARALARLILPPTACRHGRLGAPDSHWWYRCTTPPTNLALHDPLRTEERAVLVELRGTGLQTIVPPSEHPSGERLYWEEEGEPAAVADRELVERVRLLAALALVIRSWPSEGSRHEAGNGLAGALARRGFDEDGLAEVVGSVARLALDEQWRARASDARGTYRKHQRGDRTNGLPHLLDHLAADGARRERIGEWMGAAHEGAAVAWASAPTIVKTFTHIRDLLDEPEEECRWLVDGLLPAGGISMVVAKPKVGKTILAQNLCMRVSLGEPFLDRPTQQGIVLYCALEEKRSEVRRQFNAMGGRQSELLYVYVDSAPQKAMEWLKESAEKYQPVLIVVDTFQYLARLPDLNDYAVVTTNLEPLRNLARQSGAHLLFTHHGNKAGGAHGDGVLGSTGIFGLVDTLIELRRVDGLRSINSIQRYGTGLEESILEMDPETFRVSLAGSRQEVEEQDVTAEILDFLESRGEPVTQTVIDDHIEARTTLKRAALRQLVRQGQIRREGGGRRGDPYRYSCSLVPGMSREQENKQGEIGDFPREQASYSCSLDAPSRTRAPESREQETQLTLMVAEQGASPRCDCGRRLVVLGNGRGYCPECESSHARP